MSSCATVQKKPGIVTAKEPSLKDICARNGISWQWDHVSQVATLRYKGAKAKVLVGSDIVLIGNDRITLSMPVRTVRSAVRVPADFQTKVINRLKRKAPYHELHEITKVRKIIIDAGHGGKDPGAIGFKGVQEKRIVLDISKRLNKILRHRGFKVTMTRRKDEFISLQRRTEITSRANADLFISVHANSSPVRSVHGIEVFIAQDMGYKDKNEVQRKKNKKLLFKELSIKRGSTDIENIVSDMLYTYKQPEAKKLAERIVRKTVKMTKTKNRGVKKSRFFVVRNTLIPAVLVEVGFLTNPKEAKLLKTGSYREKMALALAEGIEDYVRAH